MRYNTDMTYRDPEVRKAKDRERSAKFRIKNPFYEKERWKNRIKTSIKPKKLGKPRIEKVKTVKPERSDEERLRGVKLIQKRAQLKYKSNPINQEKIFARRQVYVALRAKRLKKEPCWACGEKKVQAHHEDYSKPLDIVWLCRFHHTMGDRLIGSKGYPQILL